MKKLLLVMSMLIICLSVSAQKKMTDKEIDGLKGAVKTVANDYMPISNSKGANKNPPRKTESQYFYDKNGKLTEILYASHNFKYIFSDVDGFKTFKDIRLKEENVPKFGILGVTETKPKPIEEPEKLHAPDERYNLKFVYEYDSQGRVVAERHFQNNGKLFRLATYKYDDKGNVIEENLIYENSVTKNNHTYDAKGNLIETLEDRKLKVPGVDGENKTVYSDYKIDAQGNWTQRKRTLYFKTNDEQKTAETMEYRTIVYY